MATRPWEDEALVDRLLAALASAHALLASVATSPGGIIVLKDGQKDGPAGAGAAAAPPPPPPPEGGSSAPPPAASGAAEGEYEEFAPFAMAQHEGRGQVRHASFSEAVDAYFSKIEVQKERQARQAEERAAWNKVEKIKTSHSASLERLKAKEEEDVAKAQLVRTH